MKRLLFIMITAWLLLVAGLGGSLLMGIWLPDVISAPRHTLAEEKLASGHAFRVIHYWNRCDFYSTELHVTSPDGATKIHTLDGDASKTWRANLLIDDQKHTAMVTLGGRVVTIDW